jgi:biopolymer transport protein ExbB
MRSRISGLTVWLAIGLVGAVCQWAPAQEAEPAAPVPAPAAPVAPAAGFELEASPDVPQGPGFLQIVTGAGALGVILWLALLAASAGGIALIVDSFITIRATKIAPVQLVNDVRSAMEQGDVMKALQHCEETPVPLSNILSAGFTNVQEGFEAIQDAIGVAADMEGERLMQRVNYLNVVGNLAPMLGLLGTVQGMIFAFATLGTGAEGAAKQAALALNISQALFTTAAGLAIAVPAVAFFYFFRNRATTIILGMEGTTMDLIKVFRNVELVEE